MSGPYPPEIQQKIINSMYGLSETEIIVPGYDVEYDFINPIGLKHTLETKDVGGLYLAGQICGTTGYEEGETSGRRSVFRAFTKNTANILTHQTSQLRPRA